MNEKNNKCVYVYIDHRKPGKYVYDDLEFEFEPIYIGKLNLNRPKHHKYRTGYKYRFYTKYNKILDMITTSDIVQLVSKFGIPETSIRYYNNQLIMPTGCHNEIIGQQNINYIIMKIAKELAKEAKILFRYCRHSCQGEENSPRTTCSRCDQCSTIGKAQSYLQNTRKHQAHEKGECQQHRNTGR